MRIELLFVLPFIAGPTPPEITAPVVMSSLVDRFSQKVRPTIISGSDPCVVMPPDSVPATAAYSVQSNDYTTVLTPSGTRVKRACPAFVVQSPFRDADSQAAMLDVAAGGRRLSKPECETLRLSAVALAPRDDGKWQVVGEGQHVGKWVPDYAVCVVESASINVTSDDGLKFGAPWRWVVRAWYGADQRPLAVKVHSSGGIRPDSGGGVDPG